MTESFVKEILFDGKKCIGVKVRIEGKDKKFFAKEILSSGAIHSPAHLMRAGIGPAMDLKDKGINVLKILVVSDRG